MSCANVWMSLVFCLYNEKYIYIIGNLNSIFFVEGLLSKATQRGDILTCNLLILQSNALPLSYNHRNEYHTTSINHVSKEGNPERNAYFHSCSRSLMASFLRPYFNLKLAASRTSARWTGEPGWETQGMDDKEK